MKNFLNLLLSGLLIMSMSACGGGGGAPLAAGSNTGNTNAAGSITYTGNTNAAVISGTNANALAGNVTGSTSGATNLAGGAITASNQRANMAAYALGLSNVARNSAIDGAANGSVAVGAVQSVASTTAGAVSGTVTLSGQIDDVTLQGSITVTYNNYSDDGITSIDGSLTMSIVDFDLTNGIPLDATLQFNTITVTDIVSASGFTFSGTIHDVITIATNRRLLTVNFVAQDNITGHQSMLQNFVVDSTYDNILSPTSSADSISGRVFDSVEGYVDITTTTPMQLVINNQYPHAGGPVIFTGGVGSAGGPTQVRVTPQNATTVLVEADTNGDGNYDYSSVIPWSSL